MHHVPERGSENVSIFPQKKKPLNKVSYFNELCVIWDAYPSTRHSCQRQPSSRLAS